MALAGILPNCSGQGLDGLSLAMSLALMSIPQKLCCLLPWQEGALGKCLLAGCQICLQITCNDISDGSPFPWSQHPPHRVQNTLFCKKGGLYSTTYAKSVSVPCVYFAFHPFNFNHRCVYLTPTESNLFTLFLLYFCPPFIFFLELLLILA